MIATTAGVAATAAARGVTVTIEGEITAGGPGGSCCRALQEAEHLVQVAISAALPFFLNLIGQLLNVALALRVAR